jgi:hypothetical protein
VIIGLSPGLPRRQSETHGALGLPFTVGSFDRAGTQCAQVIPGRPLRNRAGTAAPGDERKPQVQGDAIGETDSAHGG